jgi:hypothetical protein
VGGENVTVAGLALQLSDGPGKSGVGHGLVGDCVSVRRVSRE